MGEYIEGYSSTLTDIFTNEVIYQKNSANMIERREKKLIIKNQVIVIMLSFFLYLERIKIY